jgi:hypothetical protein
MSEDHSRGGVNFIFAPLGSFATRDSTTVFEMSRVVSLRALTSANCIVLRV